MVLLRVIHQSQKGKDSLLLARHSKSRCVGSRYPLLLTPLHPKPLHCRGKVL